MLRIPCACFAAAVSARHPLFDHGNPTDFLGPIRSSGFSEFRTNRSISFKSLSINLVNRCGPPTNTQSCFSVATAALP
ncbi:hypothetical protein PF008_g17954, partial [Phytophthora fragariae]